MNIDVIIMIIVLGIALLTKILLKNCKQSKMFLTISFMIMFIILILRKPISDMSAYLTHFDKVSQLKFSEIFYSRYESLYVILVKVISIFSTNHRFFIIITALIGLIGPYYLIKNNSNNYIISIVMFLILNLYGYHFFVLRQTLAISILCFSITYIKNKSFFKFLVLVLIATLFHYTSFVFILAYFICNIKVTMKYIMLFLGVDSICFVFRKKILQLIYLIAYDNYIEKEISSQGYPRLFVMVGILIIMILINLFKDRKKNNDKKIIKIREKDDTISVFYNLLLLSIFFQIIATQASIAVRIANIFIIGLIVLVPNTIETIKNNQIKLFINWSIVLISIVYLIYFPTIESYSLFWK